MRPIQSGVSSAAPVSHAHLPHHVHAHSANCPAAIRADIRRSILGESRADSFKIQSSIHLVRCLDARRPREGHERPSTIGMSETETEERRLLRCGCRPTADRQQTTRSGRRGTSGLGHQRTAVLAVDFVADRRHCDAGGPKRGHRLHDRVGGGVHAAIPARSTSRCAPSPSGRRPRLEGRTRSRGR